jgi:hypothetical protein
MWRREMKSNLFYSSLLEFSDYYFFEIASAFCTDAQRFDREKSPCVHLATPCGISNPAFIFEHWVCNYPLQGKRTRGPTSLKK